MRQLLFYHSEYEKRQILSAFYFKWYETKMTTFFYWQQLDCLHSILKKMHWKFEGNRTIRKKVMALQRNAKPNLPSSQAGRKTSAYNCQQFQDHNLDLLSCFQLFQVFEVFDPLLSPIATYPYLFTQWPHRLLCSTHVNTIFSTVASIR